MKKEELLKLYNADTFLRLDLQFFADEGAGGEKTEDATAKRLEDARKEGQVNKSQELVNAAMLFSMFLALKIFSGFIADNLLKSFPENYSIIHVYAVEEATVSFATAIIRQGVLRIMLTLLPMLAVAVFVAFLVNVAQVKWKPTAKPMQPKLSKISPLKGAKRMFSMEKVFEMIKAIAKIGLIFYIAYTSIIGEVDTMKILYEIDLMSAVKYICNFVLNTGVKISAVYIIIGFADFIYHYFKFKKDMKMTKQEVKDEYKQQEGDPQIKGHIKSKMREASQRRMMANVPAADVVITNPTHFACAIKYDKEVAAAPVLVAKGADYVAQKIKEVAREADVPIVENKALARMLYYNVDLDSEIPQELYAMTAEVLAYVYSTGHEKKKALA
ncbi:MAG: flagellar biosynthesis protein FlhB [Lachnospiraceae bacterium]|nr:flagellar biosynthesis protein FlhB [Lachnospiraceae bacterium]